VPGGAIGEHDPAYGTGFFYRRNFSTSTTPSGTRAIQAFDVGGNVITASQNGVSISSNVTNSTNYAAPSSITTGSLTTSANWTLFLGLSSTTGPTGDTASESELVQTIKSVIAQLSLQADDAAANREKKNTVFLSCRFAENQYIEGFIPLLEQNGFSVVTGGAVNKHMSKAVLDKIKSSEFFVCLMTRDEQKSTALTRRVRGCWKRRAPLSPSENYWF
jgi:hypothetical protein